MLRSSIVLNKLCFRQVLHSSGYQKLTCNTLGFHKLEIAVKLNASSRNILSGSNAIRRTKHVHYGPPMLPTVSTAQKGSRQKGLPSNRHVSRSGRQM